MGWCVENAHPGELTVGGGSQLIEMGLRSLGDKAATRKCLQHSGFFLFLSARMERMGRRISKKRDLIGIRVQSRSFNSPKIGIREEKVVTQDDRTEALNRSRELFVSVVGSREPLNLRT